MTVTLSNVSGDDTIAPPDVLTALFFNLKDNLGSLVTLTPVSAVLDPNSHVWNAGAVEPDPAGDVVGGEWEYRGPGATALASNPSGLSQGISSSGLSGLFGNPNFPGPDLQAPTSLNGLEYGLLSAGDNPATGNGGVSSNDLVKDTTVFNLNISLAGGHTLDLSKVGALDFAFQYGTSPTEPRLRVPVAPTIPLLGAALLCMVFATRRRRFEG